MHPINPCVIHCPHCLSSSEQTEADLLQLHAACPVCGHSFTDIGQQMRAVMDGWDGFCSLVGIALALEKETGESLTDADLQNVHTLREMISVLRKHMPAETPSSQLTHLVCEAAGRISGMEEQNIALDQPLIEALKPHRWNIVVPK